MGPDQLLKEAAVIFLCSFLQ